MTRAPYACRICGPAAPESLVPVLDLGTVPLANRLLEASELDAPEPAYPLATVFCPTCSLMQITETVPPEILFRDYVYFSSFSDTMVRHAERIARRLIAERGLGPDSLVVEAASNDGYLLQHFAAAGVPTLGIEPARNVAEVARGRGIETLAEFFGPDLARRLRREGRRADVFFGANVLAHVADLRGFVAGVREVLRDDGLAVFEVPYVRDMIEKIEFDTIYHEHLCYFSLTALDRLFAEQGLLLADIERLPIHGGSLRLFARPRLAGAGLRREPAAEALLEEEALLGLDRAAYYQHFGAQVAGLRRRLRSLLCELKDHGRRIAAYGAAAKGAVLLNYCDLGAETLDFVVDRSTVKQGRFLPGKHLPILPPSALFERRPDFTLLLAWNFAEEILAQQQAYLDQGGRFVVPVPEPKIV